MTTTPHPDREPVAYVSLRTGDDTDPMPVPYLSDPADCSHVDAMCGECRESWLQDYTVVVPEVDVRDVDGTVAASWRRASFGEWAAMQRLVWDPATGWIDLQLVDDTGTLFVAAMASIPDGLADDFRGRRVFMWTRPDELLRVAACTDREAFDAFAAAWADAMDRIDRETSTPRVSLTKNGPRS